MQNYTQIYKSICRMCLNYDNVKNMVPLIEESDQGGISVYGKAVSTFADIILRKEDCLPSYMCSKCLYLLKQAIHFKLIAESSDKCLKQIINITNDTEGCIEKIVEYTMLKFYFPNSFEGFPQKRYVAQKMHKDKNCNSSSEDYNENLIKTTNEEPVYNENSDIERDSEAEQDINSDEELLDKMEKLNDPNVSNIFTTMRKQYKPLKRKQVKLKKQLVLKQRYMLAKQRRAVLRKNNLKDKNLICSICNKALANRLTLDHHMQRHNGFRYICEQCGKGFPVLHQLQMHQVSRHGTGPHIQCAQCPFKAPRKFDLIEHERIHSGERPYTCEKCGLTFRRRGIWRKHLLYHMDKNVQCPHCPKKFYQRSEMLAHANNIHNRVYVYLCNVCGATYTKTATVRRHLTERHGIPREMQGKVLRVNKAASSQEQ